MTQPSIGKPLGYYGVDTSLPEVKTLENTHGDNLQNMSQDQKLETIGQLAEGALTQTGPYGSMESDQTERLIKAIAGNL